MEEMDAEYLGYWETKRFLENEELDSMYGSLEDALSSHYDSGSPDGTTSSITGGVAYPSAAASATTDKSIIMERNRRKRLNEKLYALRSVVPNITKMDKASTIKDAIMYVQQLQEEEKKLQAEISELESMAETKISASDESDTDHLMIYSPPRKKKAMPASSLPMYARSTTIELVELKVSEIGDKKLTVSLTCHKKTGTMAKLCQIFESLNLKVITGSMTAMSGSLLHTLFVETEKMNSVQLKAKIEAAIAEFDAPKSPVCRLREVLQAHQGRIEIRAVKREVVENAHMLANEARRRGTTWHGFPTAQQLARMKLKVKLDAEVFLKKND